MLQRFTKVHMSTDPSVWHNKKTNKVYIWTYSKQKQGSDIKGTVHWVQGSRRNWWGWHLAKITRTQTTTQPNEYWLFAMHDPTTVAQTVQNVCSTRYSVGNEHQRGYPSHRAPDHTAYGHVWTSSRSSREIHSSVSGMSTESCPQNTDALNFSRAGA